MDYQLHNHLHRLITTAIEILWNRNQFYQNFQTTILTLVHKLIIFCSWIENIAILLYLVTNQLDHRQEMMQEVLLLNQK